MSTSIAVIAAHPDDDVVGAAGWLLPMGTSARVVHVTDGAPPDERLWPQGVTHRAAYARLRAHEADAALAVAGLRPRHWIALGATDQEVAGGGEAIAPPVKPPAEASASALPLEEGVEPLDELPA